MMLITLLNMALAAGVPIAGEMTMLPEEASITDQSIKRWLPGESNITVNYKLPADIPSGNYTLEMGVVFHNSIEHTIPIANKGKTDDGWYAIGSIRVNI